ncbi:MAG: type secretion system rane subunit TssM [Pseudomonadota bacterium]|jgi:type VI secretion system protein ImpL
MNRFLHWLLSPLVMITLGLFALSAVVWWIGPLIAIAGWPPLGNVWARVGVLVLIWAVWIGLQLVKALRRRRTNAALIAGMTGGPSASDKEAKVLARRFEDAVQRLQSSTGKSSWLGGGQYLYELPWYVFVGAPGSGKTTALLHAGLQFLLGDAEKGAVNGATKSAVNDASQVAVQGVGGTRNCDWWFTRDAVLIDTAGRYATQESDRDVDASAWNNFLALLKKTRPRQPINGVLLTVNVQDLLQQGATERQQHAAQLRARLQELQTKLGVRAPVYVLVTKADLIGGFNETFENLGKDERDQVWGFTFPVDAGETVGDNPLRDFASLYQQLQKRLVEQLLDRMEAERDVGRRTAQFAFPQEFAALQAPLADFLRQVCSGGGTLETTPRVRGVYFTSGTQEGSPIDRVVGALGRNFGIDPRRAGAPAGTGKSYFLNRLLRELVFAERGLGVVDARAVQRQRLLRAVVASLIGVCGVLVLLGWAVSRARNVDHAEQVAARLPAVSQAVAGLPPPATADVAPLSGVLAQVRDIARLDSFDLADPPFLNGLGLYQGDKLDGAARLAYQRLLTKALMPRVARRLEERLRASGKDNLENAYEALKTYLMLYQPDHFDAPTLRAWITSDWDQQYARMAPEQRQQLDAHLDALLALGAPRTLAQRDDTLIAQVRDLLTTFPLEYRVYSRLRRSYRAGELPEFTVAGAAGPNAGQVFMRTSGEPLGKGIPGLYTKAGYAKFIQPEVGKAVLQLGQEEGWVLGLRADPQRMKDIATGGPLVVKVKRLYFEDYIKTWDQYLDDVKLVKLDSMERSLAVTKLLGAVDSPLAAWLRAITAETRLVPAPGQAGLLDKAAAQAQAAAAKVAGGAGDGADGPVERMVDDHFAAIHRQVSGQPAPIEETLKLFVEVYNYLLAVDNAVKTKTPPPAAGALDKVKAAGGQLPPAVAGALAQVTQAAGSQGGEAERGGLAADLKPLTETCNRIVANRYPFASGSRNDTPLEDFGQLFGAGGLLDEFFQKRLLALVDTSAPAWVYKPQADGGKPVAAAALAEFQRAARIRDVFFRSGGRAPSLRVEMRVLELDPALKELDLDVDGQLGKLTVGGTPLALSWPSARLAAQIKLSSPGMATPLSFEGPWALFRFMDRFEVQPSAVPERFTLVLNLEGKRARLDVISASVFNPFQMREIKTFRCPAAL